MVLSMFFLIHDFLAVSMILQAQASPTHMQSSDVCFGDY